MTELALVLKLVLGPLPSFIGIFTHSHLAYTYAVPFIEKHLPRDHPQTKDIKGLNFGVWYVISTAFYATCGLCQLK